MICLVLIILLFANFVFAGVGIKWERESALINENEKTCLIYSVYNPWPEETNVKIEVSDESGELNKILIEQESEEKLIPAYTSSQEAIPIKFCFKTSQVYERDCWISDKFICKQECNEERVEYRGEVLVKSVPKSSEIGGTGGSATTMAVSAPLSIKIKCNAHPRNFTIIYILVILISAIVLGKVLYKKYRKPAYERDKEKLKRLREKIKKEKRKR